MVENEFYAFLISKHSRWLKKNKVLFNIDVLDVQSGNKQMTFRPLKSLHFTIEEEIKLSHELLY